MRAALVYVNNERNVGRGAGCIAASVLRAGHELAFFDTYFTPAETIAERVASGGFDVLLVSSMTMLFPEAVHLVRRVKERRRLPVLVGGIHATILGETLLDQYPEIDYLCIGEGESMVVEFLERLGTEALFDVRNLVYRREGRTVANPIRPAEDLATLPPFPWYLFPRESVVLPDTGFLYVNATRGCPYNCSYCANGIYLKHYGRGYLRFRPIEDIVQELASLDRVYRPSLFYFGDEMILSDREQAVELFRAIHDRLGRPFGCMARVEYMTPEIVRTMAESGCQYVAMGVECGDEEFRRTHLKRAMTNRQLEDAFDLVRRSGIFVTSFNMIGYPFPDDDALTEATVRLNERLRPDYVQTSIFYPFPGTVLYAHCLKNDLVDPERLARTTDYFKESVLRGVSLHHRVKEIQSRLNPRGFRFAVRPVPAAAGAPAAAAPAGRPAVLMLAFGEGEPDPDRLARARALVAAGYDVSILRGLAAPLELHTVRDGVCIHRLGNAGPAGFPRHPSLERLLAWVPPSHMGLRTFVARILWAGERAFCRRQADREFAHAKLSPFVADVVHVRGAEALTLGTWCAAKWGARLVFEPSPAGPPPAKADLARVDCVVEEGQPEAELVRAYARLAPPARAAVSG